MTFVPTSDEHNMAARAMQTMPLRSGEDYDTLKEVQLAHYDDRPARVSRTKFQQAIN